MKVRIPNVSLVAKIQWMVCTIKVFRPKQSAKCYIPGGPRLPTGPGAPSAPAVPTAPGGPGGPNAPWSPFGPIGPSTPGAPAKVKT